MLSKIKTATLILLILLSALLWAARPAQAMPFDRLRMQAGESDPVKPVAVAEVRVILIGKGW